ncbi:glycosyltransferase [Ktedonosporobacter rubrisoli]|uniref:glycosyltransferase n=1 Tax=Ktedonosporobacter rubrisoli TaxID=2509675 RepID=UPI0013EEAF0E|nr:glycosyltransferase [Ktedonosporobacter rubrisoli]
MSIKSVKHIRLLALGSQGDVQPYVALGLGLQQAGFDVSLGTTAEFRPFVEAWGLPCVTTPLKLFSVIKQDTMNEDKATTSLHKHRLKEQRRAQKIFLQLVRDIVPELARGADLLLYSFSTFLAAPHVAEKLGIPALLAAFQPVMIPTATFPSNRAPALPLGGWYNRLTYSWSERLTWLFVQHSLNAWRREKLHLPNLDMQGFLAPLHGKAQPILFGLSPTIVPRPSDWGEHIHLTGYWFLPPASAFQPSAELSAFLQAGTPPISIGFGSMRSLYSHAMLDLLKAAIKQAGVRAILIANRKHLPSTNLPEQIFLVDHIPHDWLFPRVAAAVHHGGAGTTGATLRAGIPTIVLPYLSGIDQAFWGKRVAELGVGPAPIPFSQLTADSLAQAIRQAISDEAMRKKAAWIGEQLRAENGVGNAAQVIIDFVNKGS